MWATGLPLSVDVDDEQSSVAELTGHVSVGLFAVYTILVTLVGLVGHALLGRAVQARDLVPSRALVRVMLVVGALYFTVFIAWPVPWATPVLAGMLWLCRWGLISRRRSDILHAPTSGSAMLVAVTERIPWPRLLILVAIPAAGTATYALLDQASLSETVTRDVCVNLVVAVQTVAGWVVFLAALLSVYRRRSHSSADSADPVLQSAPVVHRSAGGLDRRVALNVQLG